MSAQTKPGTKPGSGARQMQVIKVLAVGPATRSAIERTLGTRGQEVSMALSRLRRAGIIRANQRENKGANGKPATEWALTVEPKAAAAAVESADRKLELVPSKERVDWHLENWADWMHARDASLDFPDKTPGLMGGGGENVDTFYHMCATEDEKCAQVVDAIIEDLPPHERMALEHVHLAAVFSFKRLDPELTYLQARRHVAFALKARGIY